MIDVGVIGTGGYVARELIEILLRHPHARIASLLSDSHPEGTPVSKIWPRFRGRIDAATTRKPDTAVNVAIISKPTNKAQEYTPTFLNENVRVIDLSARFRFKDISVYNKTYHENQQSEMFPQAVYGLPELYKNEIASAGLVANPGCYPVSVLLGCAPLFKWNLVDPRDMIVDSHSGISGAGKSTKSDTYLYVERGENITPYEVLTHRHTPEMEQELSLLCGSKVEISFVPHLAPMIRGMMSSIYLKPRGGDFSTLPDLQEVYDDFYKDKPFARVMPSGEPPSLSSVTETNFCDIGVFPFEEQNRIVVISALDNLGKGAAGQAIQNMNIMFGIDETSGLLGSPNGSSHNGTH